MAAAPDPPPPPPAATGLTAARANAKRCTLVALLVTLAAAGIVTAFSALLCPARITFSVAHAGSSHHKSSSSAAASGATTTGAGSLLELNLTLAAANPSRRASVAYRSMFVDVSNGTAAARWDGWWVRATVTTPMPLRQPRRSVADIHATVPLVDAPWIVQAFTGNMTNSFSVMVTAQARFRVGVAWTRLYDIKVSCSPVSFFPTATTGAQATSRGAAAAAAGRPVTCV